MAGLYVHIPFCVSKCAYCAFYSMPSLKMKGAFMKALLSEMASCVPYLNGEQVNTVYFGGGTPSILSVEELDVILRAIRQHYRVSDQAEFTLEANPDTLSLDYLSALRKAGVNRLSIGIQSFFDEDLRYLSRRHDSTHARQCVGWARQAGFDNLSLDLIYGLPTATAERWRQNLDLFFETGAQHLSAYALTVEPNTILEKQIATGKALPVREDDAVRDYEILVERAAKEGFVHYEISNFARPGFRSKHNCSYWNRTPYIGFGPAAHSFDGNSRQWNVAHLQHYIDGIEAGHPDFEQETLTPEQRYDEYVMTTLRTMWGIDLKYMKRELGERFSTYCERQAESLVSQGRLTRTNEFLHLDDRQMLFADGIAAELFI